MYTQTHTYTQTPPRMPSCLFVCLLFYILQQTHRALELVINKETAVTTLIIISFYMLHQNTCHFKFMKNAYILPSWSSY